MNIKYQEILTLETRSSCVKNGDARCQLKSGKAYEDCILELEWISNTSGYVDSGTLTILNTDGATTMVRKPFYQCLTTLSYTA